MVKSPFIPLWKKGGGFIDYGASPFNKGRPGGVLTGSFRGAKPLLYSFPPLLNTLKERGTQGVRSINNQTSKDRVGEVIEAGTTQFVAQSYELYELPPLGSLVKTGDIYGIVGHAQTTSIEPNRRPIARGKDETSEEEIYRSSPQLAKLLRSEFGVVVVGHRDGDRLCQYLPPGPARIHAFVCLCPPEEVREFSQSLAFLNILLNASLPVPADELMGAALRRMSRVHEDSQAFLIAAGKELAGLLSHDFIQLKSVLGRLR